MPDSENIEIKRVGAKTQRLASLEYFYPEKQITISNNVRCDFDYIATRTLLLGRLLPR